MQKRLSIENYKEGILTKNRVILSKAITLVESTLESDIVIATELIEQILPYTGKSVRIGITGVPGVGKSTFIESFGNYIISQDKTLAVLAIDPTSSLTKGSILGDKTRMDTLSANPKAYIRPSASNNALGGVALKTRETMLLCEAAGFDVILIETVGVGQSETDVYDMTDFFLLLMLAGAGDELQGIKRGIMEMADLVAINKADSDNINKAKMAKIEYENALHLFPPKESGWFPAVVTCSGLHGIGIADIWQNINQYIEKTNENGFWNKKRANQNIKWMQQSVLSMLERDFFNQENVKKAFDKLRIDVAQNKIGATKAASELFKLYTKK
jgi:LAO/AO transport system kinase